MCEREPKPQPLTLAFIGYNEGQTRQYFAEFAKVNADQISHFDDRAGCIRFTDGTCIYRVSDNPFRLMGRRFDQLIVALDRRGVNAWPWRRDRLLDAVHERMLMSCVPDRFLTIVYDLDSEVILNDRKRQQRRAADMLIRSKSRGRYGLDDLSEMLSHLSEALAPVVTALADFVRCVSHGVQAFRDELTRVRNVEND